MTGRVSFDNPIKNIFRRIGKALSQSEGFSLFELLVVTILISISTAVAIPTYLGSIRSTSLNTATNQIITDLRKAQARSMASGISYGYIFEAGDNDYSYVKNSGTPETLEVRPLPANIEVLDTTFTDGLVSFARSGAASQTGQVRIRYSNSTIKVINVTRITGKASVQ